MIVAAPDRACDPEVGHQRVAVVHQDVARFDVAVHDFGLVRVVQRVGHLAGDLKRVVHRELALAVQPVPQRLPLDVRHHVIDQPVGLVRIVQREDVRVVQARGDLDLAEEARRAHLGGELRAEDLHRDLTFVLQVVREEHLGHAALAELAVEPVA
jgi:hypothetical protein